MRKRDSGLLVISIVVILLSLYNQNDFKANNGFTIPIDTNNYENSHYPQFFEQLPQPIITDIDGDGKNEIIYVTNDYKIKILNSIDNFNLEQTPNSPRHEASLKTKVGVSIGRRPIALKTGYTKPFSSGDYNRQVIVVVTDGWAILCFDYKLNLLWESFATDEVESGHYHSEISITVVPVSLMGQDEGLVVVGGRLEPLPNSIHKPHYKIPLAPNGESNKNDEDKIDFLSEGDDDYDKVNQKTVHKEEDSELHKEEESHFSFYAFDAKTGLKRWSHEEEDFKPVNPHEKEGHRVNQHSYKQHIYNELDHLGEVEWKVYRDSILSSLPHTWSSNFDTRLQARHFEKKVTSIKGKSDNTDQQQQQQNTGGWKSEFVGLTPTQDIFTLLTYQQQDDLIVKDPNVIVVHNKNGIEVVQIHSGRTVCRLVMDSTDFHRNSDHFIVYLDVNQDGVLDQIHSIAGNVPALNNFKDTDKKKKNSGSCVALAMAGVPPRDYLFMRSICGFSSGLDIDPIHINTGNHKDPHYFQTAPPTFIQNPITKKLDTIFFVNTGKISSVQANGKQNWKVTTESTWKRHIEPHTFPSIQVISMVSNSNYYTQQQQQQKQQYILAIGGESMTVLDDQGNIVIEKSFEEKAEKNPVMGPPVIGDLNNDGYNDFLIPTLFGYKVYLTEKTSYTGSSSSLLLPLIGFIVLVSLLFLLITTNQSKSSSFNSNDLRSKFNLNTKKRSTD
ncbi:hypothetical protein CYY_004457 [Polysphondylium violaceum]|uniref:FG-GAP repeat-containing protein n=1 Tax=Polysphondylium violaceum TaxID=133409 RepID=A0A8J4PWP4_9MYCE|nr:hypothetical protein CYY_004457 [Polysphondylium violaceum]